MNQYSTDEFEKGQKAFENAVIIICAAVVAAGVGVYIFLNHVTIVF